MLNLTPEDVSRLRAQFRYFRDERRRIMIDTIKYIAAYRAPYMPPEVRKLYLNKKAPRNFYPLMIDDGFYWSVKNIALLNVKSRSSIIRTMQRMNGLDQWREKLSPLKLTAATERGRVIDVYHQDIFDLLIDFWEEEYLMRFARPRHGDPAKAPSIDELRSYWESLKAEDARQFSVFVGAVGAMPPPQSVIPAGGIAGAIAESLRRVFRKVRQYIGVVLP